MIIRMTVQDNDFAEFLESFVKNLKAKIVCNNDARKNIRKTVEIFSKSANGKVIADEDKSFIRSQVNKVWQDIVNKNQIANEDLKHYLVSNFQVDIIDSFQEKWENGEYVYYFSNSNTIIAQ